MDRREFCVWCIFLRENDLLVGEIHLHHWDWTIPKCEIGYWGRTGYLGRGLVTEAAKAVLSMASTSLGVRRVEALCETRNEASQRFARRVGFVQEAILRDHDLDVGGKLCDEVLFVWEPGRVECLPSDVAGRPEELNREPKTTHIK
jgi:RimJ/RimL family protein N-acetyltransferase